MRMTKPFPDKPSLAQAICRIGGQAVLLALTLILSFSANGLSAARSSPQSSGDAAGAGEAAELVAKLADRLASYPELTSWQARAHATTSFMTSSWKPKKTTTTEKIVTADGKLWSEEILSAVETEDGRTRDVTDDARAEARERAEKQRRATDEGRKEDQRRRGRRSLDMTRDEVLPFNPEKHSGYDFTLKGPSDLDGAPVIVLQSRSRVRSQDKLEGLYYIDPETYDVLRAELTIAKRPAPLKRMEMEMEFQVLPSGHQVLTRAVMRMHIGLVVKNIRIEAIETYTDHIIREN
jgi:hypothetical protein